MARSACATAPGGEKGDPETAPLIENFLKEDLKNVYNGNNMFVIMIFPPRTSTAPVFSLLDANLGKSDQTNTHFKVRILNWIKTRYDYSSSITAVQAIIIV